METDEATSGGAVQQGKGVRPAFAWAFEKLAVWQAADRAFSCVAREKAALRGVPGDLVDQLHRALISVSLNIAEGAGRRTPLDQRRCYAIALGSAAEAVAALHLLRHLALPSSALAEADAELRAVGPMLLALMRRLKTGN